MPAIVRPAQRNLRIASLPCRQSHPRFQIQLKGTMEDAIPSARQVRSAAYPHDWLAIIGKDRVAHFVQVAILEIAN